jgi:hypothetical protein
MDNQVTECELIIPTLGALSRIAAFAARRHFGR